LTKVWPERDFIVSTWAGTDESKRVSDAVHLGNENVFGSAVACARVNSRV